MNNANEFETLYKAQMARVLSHFTATKVRAAKLGRPGDNLVIVPSDERGKQGQFYCRIEHGDSVEVIQARNTSAELPWDEKLLKNLPVLVGYGANSNELVVLGVDPNAIGEWLGGVLPSQMATQIAQMTTLDRLQFLRLRPVSGMAIGVTSGHTVYNGELVWLPRQSFGDMTSYIPGTANTAVWVRVTYDLINMEPYFDASDEFSASEAKSTTLLSYLDTAIPTGHLLLGGVYCYNGQTELTLADIIPLLPIGTAGGSGDGVQLFTGLTDTPAGYAAAGSIVQVNATADGLIFGTVMPLFSVAQEYMTGTVSGLLPAQVELEIDDTSATITADSTGSVSGVDQEPEWGVSNDYGAAQWRSTDTAFPHWLEVEFGAAVTATAYHLEATTWPNGGGDGVVEDWTLQYWDGDSWEDLDSETAYDWGVDWSSVQNSREKFTIASPQSATKYRLYITGTEDEVTSTAANVRDLSFYDKSTYYEALGQSFSLAEAASLSGVTLRLGRSGTVSSYDMTLKLYNDTAGGSLGSLVATSATVSCSGIVNETAQDIAFSFSSPVSLAAGSYYRLVLETDAPASSSAYIKWFYGTDSTLAGTYYYKLNSTWYAKAGRQFNYSLTAVTIDSWLTLAETPASFDSQAGKLVRVNSGETALEFFDLKHQTHYYLAGTLSAGTGALRIPNRTGRSLTIQTVYLDVNTAPTGQALIVDVNNAGTTIFNTLPQVADGANSGSSGDLSTSTWAQDEYLTVDIDQVGSTVAGSDLTVTIVYS